MERCPGQDPRYLKPSDVYEVPCPSCGARVEFFRDDRSRRCPACGTRFRNPHRDVGCAKWCPYAKECIDHDDAPDKSEHG